MIFSKLFIVEIDYINKFTRIVIWVMLQNSYKNTYSYLVYITNFWNSLLNYTKYYCQDFFKKTFIQKNGYKLYHQCNNDSIYKIPYSQEWNCKFIINNLWVVLYLIYLT